VDVAGGIILFLIRAVIALLPIVLLIVLPLALIAKFVIRRLRRKWNRSADAQEAGAAG